MPEPKSELKDCPFCGGSARETFCAGEAFIECPQCRVFTEAASEQEAIAAWNRRTPSALDKLAHAIAECSVKCSVGESFDEREAEKLIVAYSEARKGKA